ncbi:nitroreductase family protein [Ruminococcaceae bacterium OttesenSCG-928-A11]|nr:nitroreductase family protein [Ruminococcaceae bacterium OttesenSCG-928-A11]
MDLFEAINGRYSYRGAYTDAPVPQADLEKMLAAGVAAPSGHNFQTPVFAAITDTDKCAKIAEILPGPNTATAKAYIVVLSHEKFTEHNMQFELQDFAAATENILLAVHALGYATVWIEGRLFVNDVRGQLHTMLNAPADYTVRALLPLGVAAEEVKHPPKQAYEERVKFNSF